MHFFSFFLVYLQLERVLYVVDELLFIKEQASVTSTTDNAHFEVRGGQQGLMDAQTPAHEPTEALHETILLIARLG